MSDIVEKARKPNKQKELPDRIFKYYSFDEKFNESRLTGDVYLASPLDFNDVFDCQLEGDDNIDEMYKKKGEEWVKGKLFEIGLDWKLEDYNKNPEEYSKKIREKQLEKFGILCSTSVCNNNIMWGYYTNHSGFCIEYDKDLIIKRLIIGFVNKLSWDLTKHLFEKKEYNRDVEERNKDPYEQNKDLYEQKLNSSKNIFVDGDIDSISNCYLCAKKENEERAKIINFVRNIYVKRFGDGHVNYKYNISNHDSKPKLFYDGDLNSIKLKYYTKGKKWESEEEYRFTVSLGGRTVVNLGKDCIKSIRVGCNMSDLHLFEIVSILSKHEMNDIKLIKMIKDRDKLEDYEISLKDLIKIYKAFKNKVHKNTTDDLNH